jgi:hypothetical protein
MVHYSSLKKLFKLSKTTTDLVSDLKSNSELNKSKTVFHSTKKNAESKTKLNENEYKYESSETMIRRPRLVKKSGELNIQMENVLKRKRRLMGDIFNTILDIKWRWHFLVFFLSFVLSWLLFASIYYLIALFHGDLDQSFDLPNSNITDNNNNQVLDDNIISKRNPCVFGKIFCLIEIEIIKFNYILYI